MLAYMDRNRSTILATLALALVCGPVSSLLLIRIAGHMRRSQWLLAGAWSTALVALWGAMLLLTVVIIQFKLRAP